MRSVTSSLTVTIMMPPALVPDFVYLTGRMIGVIKEWGPENIFGVVMDGACKKAFEHIRLQYPHIQCWVCIAHSVDLFLKAIGSDRQQIRIMKNELKDSCSDTGMTIIDWDEPLFCDTFEQVWEIVKFITNRTFPLARFRAIVKKLQDEEFQFTDGQSLLGFANCR